MSLLKTSPATVGNRRDTNDPWQNFFDVEDFFSPFWPAKSRNFMPAVNVAEDSKQYSVDIVAPGFKKEDFKVNMENDTLTISAESRNASNETDKQYSRREYSYSSFTHSFKLPENVKDDSISAQYVDGVLKLTIPKSEEEVKAPKQIEVS